ncbi:hypothetical protein B0H14DRAFT_2612292 [Mycena olivaceomarginata]|nr:hypothetical protein B0H14DRAFT_2612292 [Mycena olivaceomarginata]
MAFKEVCRHLSYLAHKPKAIEPPHSAPRPIKLGEAEGKETPASTSSSPQEKERGTPPPHPKTKGTVPGVSTGKNEETQFVSRLGGKNNSEEGRNPQAGQKGARIHVVGVKESTRQRRRTTGGAESVRNQAVDLALLGGDAYSNRRYRSHARQDTGGRKEGSVSWVQRKERVGARRVEEAGMSRGSVEEGDEASEPTIIVIASTRPRRRKRGTYDRRWYWLQGRHAGVAEDAFDIDLDVGVGRGTILGVQSTKTVTGQVKDWYNKIASEDVPADEIESVAENCRCSVGVAHRWRRMSRSEARKEAV